MKTSRGLSLTMYRPSPIGDKWAEKDNPRSEAQDQKKLSYQVGQSTDTDSASLKGHSNRYPVKSLGSKANSHKDHVWDKRLKDVGKTPKQVRAVEKGQVIWKEEGVQEIIWGDWVTSLMLHKKGPEWYPSLESNRGEEHPSWALEQGEEKSNPRPNEREKHTPLLQQELRRTRSAATAWSDSLERLEQSRRTLNQGVTPTWSEDSTWVSRSEPKELQNKETHT